MKRGLLAVLLMISVATITSCSKSSSDGGNNLKYLKATIDGNDFAATDISSNYQINGSTKALYITGTDASSGKYIMLQIFDFKDTAATYTIPGDAYGEYSTNGSIYSRSVVGQIQVTDINTQTASGTFIFETSDSVKITGGGFRATLPN